MYLINIDMKKNVKLRLMTKIINLLLFCLTGYVSLYSQDSYNNVISDKQSDIFINTSAKHSQLKETLLSNLEAVELILHDYSQDLIPVINNHNIKNALTGTEKEFHLLRDSSEQDVDKMSYLFNYDNLAVPFPFISTTKRNIIGNSAVISGNQLNAYNSTDIRNAFSGIVTGLDVRELNGAPGLHAEEGSYDLTQKIQLNSRGTTPIFIIDDLVADIYEIPLDPQEIETVTIVKDIIGKTMYGPRAANGIIYIKTKRGNTNKRLLNVKAETGLSRVDRFPSWVSGADYAHLNNLARQNSQMAPLYSQSAINSFANNDPYDKYFPSIKFRDMLLNESRSFTRINLSSIGGSENGDVKYFAYVGYNGEGDDFKLGSTASYDRLNIRSNIDLKITNNFNARFGIFGGLSINRAPNYGYYTSETHSNFSISGMNPLLSDITTIPPIAFPIYAAYDEDEKIPFYGVSSTYRSNPIGSIVNCGYYKETTRTSVANLSLDYDLSDLIPGLKSTSYGIFNILTLSVLGNPKIIMHHCYSCFNL